MEELDDTEDMGELLVKQGLNDDRLQDGRAAARRKLDLDRLRHYEEWFVRGFRKRLTQDIELEEDGDLC